MVLQFRIHESSINSADQGYHPDLWGRLLYLIVPYAVLLVVSFIFHRKSIESQIAFPIYPLPTLHPQTIIYYLVVAFLGVIGIFAALGDLWTAYDWILYLVANILVALYIFLYQLTSRFTLFLTSIVAVALAIDVQWLFIETSSMQNGFSNLVVRNLVGAVGAWAMIYALLTVGQFLVYTVGFNKTFQAICFFIAGILLLGGISFWNKSSYCEWDEVVGFTAVGMILLIFCAMNTHRNKSSDLDSLLD